VSVVVFFCEAVCCLFQGESYWGINSVEWSFHKFSVIICWFEVASRKKN